MAAAAPSASARAARAAATAGSGSLTPVTIGTAPALSSSTVASTSARSASSRYAASPITPSAVSPRAPLPSALRTALRSDATSTAPAASNGVGRTWKSPSNAGTPGIVAAGAQRTRTLTISNGP